jgi:hypothetical protein
MGLLIVTGIIVWIIISIIIGNLGSERKIGFGKAFFASLLITPLIGILFVMESERNSDYELKKTIYHYIIDKK